MTDKEALALYRSLIPFLAEVCGPASEIVLHDLSDPGHSLIAIENNRSGREIGNPLTDLAREIVSSGSYRQADFKINYTGKSKDRKFLSSTYYIKNQGRLIGLLCVNKDMSGVGAAQQELQRLLQQFNLCLPEEETRSPENLANPVEELQRSQIADVIRAYGVAPSHMSREDRIAVVRRLQASGILLVKGSVPEIARQLMISVPTVYRYLNQRGEG